jgi:hypothetical protein
VLDNQTLSRIAKVDQSPLITIKYLETKRTSWFVAHLIPDRRFLNRRKALDKALQVGFKNDGGGVQQRVWPQRGCGNFLHDCVKVGLLFGGREHLRNVVSGRWHFFSNKAFLKNWDEIILSV